MILKCTHCGKDLERMIFIKNPCCFTCKRQRNIIMNYKKKYGKLKKKKVVNN